MRCLILVTLIGFINCRIFSIYEVPDLYRSDPEKLLSSNKFGTIDFFDNEKFYYGLGFGSCVVDGGNRKHCNYNGKETYNGLLNGSNKNINEKTVYTIGSLTKTFMCAALLRMIQEKPAEFPNQLDTKLSYYYDRLVSYYPNSVFIKNLKNRLQFDKITLKHLAQHTAGFGSENVAAFADGVTEEIYMNSENNMEHLFGTHLYSNIGSNMLGMIMKTIAKQSFANILKAYVLRPLSLNETFTVDDLVNTNDRVEIADNRRSEFSVAQAYYYTDGKIRFRKKYEWDLSLAGVHATLNDMIKFVQNFFKNEKNLLFNQNTIKLRDLRPVKANDKGDFYGIGFNVLAEGSKGHYGLDIGTNIMGFYNPYSKTTFVGVMTSEAVTKWLTSDLYPKENDDRKFDRALKLREKYSIEELVHIIRFKENLSPLPQHIDLSNIFG